MCQERQGEKGRQGGKKKAADVPGETDAEKGKGKTGGRTSRSPAGSLFQLSVGVAGVIVPDARSILPKNGFPQVCVSSSKFLIQP